MFFRKLHKHYLRVSPGQWIFPATQDITSTGSALLPLTVLFCSVYWKDSDWNVNIKFQGTYFWYMILFGNIFIFSYLLIVSMICTKSSPLSTSVFSWFSFRSSSFKDGKLGNFRESAPLSILDLSSLILFIIFTSIDSILKMIKDFL